MLCMHGCTHASALPATRMPTTVSALANGSLDPDPNGPIQHSRVQFLSGSRHRLLHSLWGCQLLMRPNFGCGILESLAWADSCHCWFSSVYSKSICGNATLVSSALRSDPKSLCPHPKGSSCCVPRSVVPQRACGVDMTTLPQMHIV